MKNNLVDTVIFEIYSFFQSIVGNEAASSTLVIISFFIFSTISIIFLQLNLIIPITGIPFVGISLFSIVVGWILISSRIKSKKHEHWINQNSSRRVRLYTIFATQIALHVILILTILSYRETAG